MTARPRVVLKPVRGVADVGLRRWCGWLNDRRTSRYLESDGRWTPKRLAAWVATCRRQKDVRLYAITLGGLPCGTLKLDGVRPGGLPSLGLMIGDPSRWGRGLGRQAIVAGCAAARVAACRGVWAGIRAENARALAAFSRAGFREVARRTAAPGESWRGLPPELVAGMRCWPADPPRVAVLREFARGASPLAGVA